MYSSKDQTCCSMEWVFKLILIKTSFHRPTCGLYRFLFPSLNEIWSNKDTLNFVTFCASYSMSQVCKNTFFQCNSRAVYMDGEKFLWKKIELAKFTKWQIHEIITVFFGIWWWPFQNPASLTTRGRRHWGSFRFWSSGRLQSQGECKQYRNLLMRFTQSQISMCILFLISSQFPKELCFLHLILKPSITTNPCIFGKPSFAKWISFLSQNCVDNKNSFFHKGYKFNHNNENTVAQFV